MKPLAKIAAHLEETIQALRKVDLQDVERITTLLEVTRKTSSFVWLVGNGGSAATASHLANDLHKQCGIRAIALPDMTPLVTAYGNDSAWQEMFSNAMDGYYRTGDMLIAFSCSGNSENVIKAASGFYGDVIVFTGNNQDSKLVQEAKASVILHVESPDIMVQESVHLAVCHALVAALKPVSPRHHDTADAMVYAMKQNLKPKE